MSITSMSDAQVGDVLENHTIFGYPTLIIEDPGDPKQLKSICEFTINSTGGFRFIWFNNNDVYEVWYAGRCLGEIVETGEGAWRGRWGSNLDYSPYYEIPLQAARWLLVSKVMKAPY